MDTLVKEDRQTTLAQVAAIMGISYWSAQAMTLGTVKFVLIGCPNHLQLSISSSVEILQTSSSNAVKKIAVSQITQLQVRRHKQRLEKSVIPCSREIQASAVLQENEINTRLGHEET